MLSNLDDYGNIQMVIGHQSSKISEWNKLVYDCTSKKQKRDEILGIWAKHGPTSAPGICLD